MSSKPRIVRVTFRMLRSAAIAAIWQSADATTSPIGKVVAHRRLDTSVGSDGRSRGVHPHRLTKVAGTALDGPVCQVPIPRDRLVAVGLGG